MSERTARSDISVTIPVSATSEGVVDARMYLPVEMTEQEWEQMHRVLDAMKPALVIPRAVGRPENT